MMLSLQGVTIVWLITVPHTLCSGASSSSLMLKYERTTAEHVCDKVTYAVYNKETLPSCTLLCRVSADCSAFGYGDNEASQNCLLMSSDTTKEKKTTASYTGYHFYLMVEDLSNSWMIFQRRTSGNIDFSRNWTEYKNGFGHHCEFWLGNDKLHELTKDGEYRLRIELEDNDGVMAAAEWDTFIVGEEQSNYQLTVGGFNGADPPGDSMTYHNLSGFSTIDADNDAWIAGSCVSKYKGGWWYNRCVRSNLNGEYGNLDKAMGINWKAWKGHWYTLSGSKMMIKKN